MGVGYSASPLHRISYLDLASSGFTSPSPRDLPPDLGALNARHATGPVYLRSPTAAEIIAWRDRLAVKYREQLGEALTWDEQSNFEISEDIAISCEVCLHYVAAIIEESGPRAVRRLIDTDIPTPGEIERAVASVERRGFSGPFPQLKLVARFWLPFRRNMIIEEPDWQTRTRRYGSSYRLADELEELRQLIKDADPRSVDWTERSDLPAKTLWAAWQASATIVRICNTANSRHLPLWTTG